MRKSLIIFLISFFFVGALFFAFNLAVVLFVCFFFSISYYTFKIVSFRKRNILKAEKVKNLSSLFSNCYFIAIINKSTKGAIYYNDRQFYKKIDKHIHKGLSATLDELKEVKCISFDGMHVFVSEKKENDKYSIFDEAVIPIFVSYKDEFVYLNKVAQKMDIKNVDQEDVRLTKILKEPEGELFCALPVCRNDLDVFVESSPVPAIKINTKGKILSRNNLFNKYTNLKKYNIHNYLTLGHSRAVTEYVEQSTKKEVGALELVLKAESSHTKNCFAVIMPIGQEFICQFIDITKYKNIETNFTHSQKMQAVGQLAGGIAHDFNNLLTAMLGYCDLLLIRHPVGDPSFADIMQIKQNALRSSSLVKQLLAISRKEVFSPKKIDVNDAIEDLSNLISRLIDGKVKFKRVFGRGVKPIKIDQSQFDQVIINLVVNARDAIMSSGKKSDGMLVVTTKNFLFNKQTKLDGFLINVLDNDQISKGEYVLVSIRDNGVGIKQSVLDKIFEPYFSTKKAGSGTGLGLSTVYGIIKQANGHLLINTKVGQGTDFQILFPAYEPTQEDDQEVDSKKIEEVDLTGEETILLIEDEAPVRTFSAYALENKGYTVIQAESSEEAMKIIESNEHKLDLIISDVMMPGMTGVEMTQKLHERNLDIKVIFISGYGEEILSIKSSDQKNISFLPKPFELKDLISKVREVLDGSKNH
ncbi:MAG: response regulator [Rickettsiales bacterium]